MITNNSIRNIAFAGSGNVAWHLATGLELKGFHIAGIWSHDFVHASALAESCNSVAFKEISSLKAETDLIIIAVPDKAIDEVASAIGNFEGIVVHTAGSVSVDGLKTHSSHYGSFYPLQTFSKDIPVDFSDVPFFLEASNQDDLSAIRQVASELSSKVYEADSAKRLLLHVAAVFAGNYSNLMYSISNEILKTNGLPIEVLHPLMLETTRKAVHGDPLMLQTGPARRSDIPTIEKHIEALASFPEYAELYSLLAQLIIKQHK